MDLARFSTGKEVFCRGFLQRADFRPRCRHPCIRVYPVMVKRNPGCCYWDRFELRNQEYVVFLFLAFRRFKRPTLTCAS